MGAELDLDARNRALDSLASGATVVAASKASGYSRVHIYRLLQDPRFVEELEKRRASMIANAPADELLALTVLRSIAEGVFEAKDRVAAAKALLAHVQLRRVKGPGATKAAETPRIKIVPAGEAGASVDKWLEKA